MNHNHTLRLQKYEQATDLIRMGLTVSSDCMADMLPGIDLFFRGGNRGRNGTPAFVEISPSCTEYPSGDRNRWGRMA